MWISSHKVIEVNQNRFDVPNLSRLGPLFHDPLYLDPMGELRVLDVLLRGVQRQLRFHLKFLNKDMAFLDVTTLGKLLKNFHSAWGAPRGLSRSEKSGESVLFEN